MTRVITSAPDCGDAVVIGTTTPPTTQPPFRTMATRYLHGTLFNDRLKARNDGATHFIKGYSGDDLLIGGFGNDHLDGGAGDDNLYGANGMDVLAGGRGNDRLDGGKGFDKAIFGNANNRIDLRNTRAQNTGEGFDTLVNIEAVHGGGGKDLIIGNALANLLEGGSDDDKLYGLDGNDRLDGGSGDDFLVGGVGRDVMTGGTGKDTFYVGHGGDADTITDFRDYGDQVIFANTLDFLGVEVLENSMKIYDGDIAPENLYVTINGIPDDASFFANPEGVVMWGGITTGNASDWIDFGG